MCVVSPIVVGGLEPEQFVPKSPHGGPVLDATHRSPHIHMLLPLSRTGTLVKLWAPSPPLHGSSPFLPPTPHQSSARPSIQEELDSWTSLNLQDPSQCRVRVVQAKASQVGRGHISSRLGEVVQVTDVPIALPVKGRRLPGRAPDSGDAAGNDSFDFSSLPLVSAVGAGARDAYAMQGAQGRSLE